MTRHRYRIATTVGIVLTGLVLGACGPSDPPASPTPTPVTSDTPTPTPSPTPSPTGPTEADFKAAEKAYRDFTAERGRLSMAGGTDKATKAMTDNAAGPFLEEMLGYLRQQKSERYKTDRAISIAYVRPSSVKRAEAPTNEITLKVCEDGSKVKTLDSDGDVVRRGHAIKASLYARYIDGRWKIWDGDGEEVDSCSG